MKILHSVWCLLFLISPGLLASDETDTPEWTLTTSEILSCNTPSTSHVPSRNNSPSASLRRKESRKSFANKGLHTLSLEIAPPSALNSPIQGTCTYKNHTLTVCQRQKLGEGACGTVTVFHITGPDGKSTDVAGKQFLAKRAPTQFAAQILALRGLLHSEHPGRTYIAYPNFVLETPENLIPCFPIAPFGDLQKFAETRDKPTSLAEIKLILKQGALAIQAFHSVVKWNHCDIKPPNILVMEIDQDQNITKILLTDEDLHTPTQEPKATSSYTARYVAPEAVRGINHPTRDFFSLGMVGLFLVKELGIFYKNQTNKGTLLYGIGRDFTGIYYKPYIKSLGKKIKRLKGAKKYSKSKTEKKEKLQFILDYLVGLIHSDFAIRETAFEKVLALEDTY